MKIAVALITFALSATSAGACMLPPEEVVAEPTDCVCVTAPCDCEETPVVTN